MLVLQKAVFMQHMIFLAFTHVKTSLQGINLSSLNESLYENTSASPVNT